MRKQLIGFVPIVALLFLVDSLGDRWIVPPVIVFGTLLASASWGDALLVDGRIGCSSALQCAS